MAYDALEASAFSGRREEFYYFELVGTWKVYRYTPMRLPVSYQGFEYAPKAIERGSYTFKKEASSNDTFKLEVQSDLDLLENFKIIVPAVTMRIKVFRRHRGDADGNVKILFNGRVRGVTWEGAKATIECDSMNAMAKRGGISLNYQVPCNNFIYDDNCRLQAGDWKVQGPISSISSNTVVSSPAFADKPDGWLKYGFMEANGAYYMIINHVGASITLLHGLEGVQVGQVVSAYAGCDQRLSTCSTKFNNHLNYVGFPWSPAKNLFESGI